MATMTPYRVTLAEPVEELGLVASSLMKPEMVIRAICRRQCRKRFASAEHRDYADDTRARSTKAATQNDSFRRRRSVPI